MATGTGDWFGQQLVEELQKMNPKVALPSPRTKPYRLLKRDTSTDLQSRLSGNIAKLDLAFDSLFDLPVGAQDNIVLFIDYNEMRMWTQCRLKTKFSNLASATLKLLTNEGLLTIEHPEEEKELAARFILRLHEFRTIMTPTNEHRCVVWMKATFSDPSPTAGGTLARPLDSVAAVLLPKSGAARKRPLDLDQRTLVIPDLSIQSSSPERPRKRPRIVDPRLMPSLLQETTLSLDQSTKK